MTLQFTLECHLTCNQGKHHSTANGYIRLIISRPYWVVRSRLWYNVLSICRLSVTFYTVAKRYVVEGRRRYRWIGRW